MKFKIAMMMVALSLLLLGVDHSAAAAKKAAKKTKKTVPTVAFVSSEACMKCHLTEYQSWKETLHSKMIRTKQDGILKEAVQKWKSDGAGPGPTKANITGKDVTLDDVVYVVGSHWKQRYLVKNDETGGHQFLNRQFNSVSGKWENYGHKNDWETSCATCHAMGYKVVKYDPASHKVAKASFTEMNIGCETCHGPGGKHVSTKAKKDIWNQASQPKEVQSRTCGYCHIRLENEKFKTAQGNNAEHFPAPKVGDSFKPWDDWRTWYPDGVVIPGIQPDQPFDKKYTQADFQGVFLVDDISKKNGVFEEGKHHQEYAGFIQSSHYKKNILSCIDCHTPHAVKGKSGERSEKGNCAKCHGEQYTVEKIMPATGKTANNLYLRTHTFNKNQSRPSGKTSPFGYSPDLYYQK
jgi:hypothetical protein